MWRDERGVAWTYIIGVIAIFATISLWYIFTGPLGEVLAVAENLHENSLADPRVWSSLKGAWNLMPIIVTIGIIIWMIVRSQVETGGWGLR